MLIGLQVTLCLANSLGFFVFHSCNNIQGSCGLVVCLSQAECLNQAGVLDGSNLVYCAPTSGGKSLVAEVLMLRRLVVTGKAALLVRHLAWPESFVYGITFYTPIHSYSSAVVWAKPSKFQR